MRRLILTIAACFAVFLTALPHPGSAAPPRPHNLSSHPPEFFRDLLAGRVFVYEHHDKPAAFHYAKDGAVFACWYNPARNRFLRAYPNTSWQIGTPRGRSNLEERWTTPSGMQRHLRRIIIYTPKTGRFHVEAYVKKRDAWVVSRNGWIQNAWPKILLEQCPKLVLPYRLPIDEYQDSLDFKRVKNNASPIRNHPGSELGYPGATGLAATNGKPTMTPDEVRAAIQRYHGYISEHNRGNRVVYVKRLDHGEVWVLDAANGIRDVGIIRLQENNSVLATAWQNTGRTTRRLAGYPMPAIPTSTKHPVFKMMDDLISSKTPVAIASGSGRPITHIFHPDGTLGTETSTGNWEITRGEVHFTVNGVSRAYPWRKFAELSGWKN